MPLTGALKEWVAKLKAYQQQHGVSYKAAMSALKGKGARKSHRGGGVADAAEAFTPQADKPAAHALPAAETNEVAGFQVKALPQSGGSGELSMFEVGATLQKGGRRKRKCGSKRRGSKRRGSKRRGSKRGRTNRRSRSHQGGSSSSLTYSDYA